MMHRFLLMTRLSQRCSWRRYSLIHRQHIRGQRRFLGRVVALEHQFMLRQRQYYCFAKSRCISTLHRNERNVAYTSDEYRYLHLVQTFTTLYWACWDDAATNIFIRFAPCIRHNPGSPGVQSTLAAAATAAPTAAASRESATWSMICTVSWRFTSLSATESFFCPQDCRWPRGTLEPS